MDYPLIRLFQVDLTMFVWLQYIIHRLNQELCIYFTKERKRVTIYGKRLDQCGATWITTLYRYELFFTLLEMKLLLKICVSFFKAKRSN
jgi:hypothetical protein